MRFLPVFLDLTSGTVALIGSGPAAANKLRLLQSAGARVRWYSGSADVAEEVLLAGAAAGRLELSFADPLQADFSEFIGVVAAAGGALDEDVAAQSARRQCAGQCGRPGRAVDLHLSRHDRSRRGGGRHRHQRRLAGAGAPFARAHRSVAAGAHRRSRRPDGSLPRTVRRRCGMRRSRCGISGSAWSTGRSAPPRSPGAGARPRWRWCARSRARAIRSTIPASCSWSAPVRAIPIS